MIYHNLQSYTKAKIRWENRSGSIINGKGFFYHEGKLIPDEEWLKHNSEPYYEPQPRCNPDGTHIPSGIMPIKRDK